MHERLQKWVDVLRRGGVELQRVDGREMTEPDLVRAFALSSVLCSNDPECANDHERTSADLVREMRHAAEMTREQLAIALGVSTPTIARWELGGTSLTLVQLQRVAHATDSVLRITSN